MAALANDAAGVVVELASARRHTRGEVSCWANASGADSRQSALAATTAEMQRDM
jgi:hypothetical protein